MSKTRRSSEKNEATEPKTAAIETETAATPKPEVKKAPAKSVKAVFVPVGLVNVHLETPGGNEYNLVPRKVFIIAAEDVDWFFNDWDWCFRQRLVRASDYKPTCGYYDPKTEVEAPAAAEAGSGEKE